jgi:hypothetical protein
MDVVLPDYVASPELPQVDKPGAELYAAGYRQMSSKYRIFAVPPHDDITLEEMLQAIKQKSHLHYTWLRDFILHQITDVYFREAAPCVGLTNQQFADFKKAQKEGDPRKWNYEYEPIPDSMLRKAP